jgi:hypothetical protein
MIQLLVIGLAELVLIVAAVAVGFEAVCRTI